MRDFIGMTLVVIGYRLMTQETAAKLQLRIIQFILADNQQDATTMVEEFMNGRVN